MQRWLSFLLSFLLLLSLLIASLTNRPLSLSAQACSDNAEVVEQTFDPPAATLAPNASFAVEWTVRNSGDCTWSSDYRLIFAGGERMDGPRTTRLRSEVEPGESVTFALELSAPEDDGSYSGTWRLRNAEGDTFGPELTVAIDVGASSAATAATSEVVLPEVLVFGGMGAGEDPNVIVYCVEDGEVTTSPKLVVDVETLEWRYTSLFVCSLPEGTEVTVEIVDPEGNSFSRDFVEDAPISGEDEAGNQYTGTLLQVHLTWLKQAPAGDWLVTVSSEEYTDKITISLPEVAAPAEGETYPMLDNWPTAPIDPFAASEGCHYAYRPGQEMVIGGNYLPPNSTLAVGVYQDRLTFGYLIDQLSVTTDAEGSFALPYQAQAETGMYHVVLLQSLNPEGFSEDGTQYDPAFDEGSAYSCFSVVLEEVPELPLRLAFAVGEAGMAEIEVYDLIAGYGHYPSYNGGGVCDISEPSWWPDGEWIVYQSNCARPDDDDWFTLVAQEDYDLFALMVDATYAIPEQDKYVRFTATPDLHESEPDANLDGLIVYVETPLGEPLEAGGELRLLDIFEETDTSLGLFGRAPAWSPDGTRIAFMSDLEGNWQIYVYDLEDEALWVVSDDCATHCRMPAWSPNGRQVIYEVAASTDDLTPAGLWITSVAGISRPRLFLEGTYGRPTWSAEGWIVFEGPDGLYRATIGAEPTLERYLYNSEWATYWSPEWSR